MRTTQLSLDGERGKLTTPQALLIGSVLALFTLAFLPTFLVDYVPMDQWRVFRYSLDDQGGWARLSACVNMDIPFYLATGRPLVWQGECIEHSLVARIADFRILRPFCFLIVLATLIGMVYSLRGLIEDPALATIVAALALYSPSYCFMYYQGLTGALVLIAALFAIISFSLLVPVDFGSLAGIRKSPRRILASVALLVLADFMYPAYATVGIAIALLYAIFDQKLSFSARAYRYSATLFLYGAAALTYFLASKLLIFWYFRRHPDVLPILRSVESSDYAFSPHMDPTALLSKFKTLWVYFSDRLPVSSFNGLPPVVMVGILAAFIIVAAADVSLPSARRLSWLRLLLASVGLLIGALAMVAPWFASGFSQDLGSRLALSWAILFASGLALLSSRLLTWMRPNMTALTRSSLLFALLFVPASARHLKATIDQVMMSNVEVRFLRTSLKDLIASKQFPQRRHLHVIRPAYLVHYDNSPRKDYDDESRIPASTADPEHIYEMITAILRELLPNSEVEKLKIHDCRFDEQCALSVVEAGGMALTQGYETDPVPAGKSTAVIDFRLSEPGPVRPQALAARQPFDVTVYPESIGGDGELAFDHNVQTFFESTQGFPVRLLLSSEGACHPVASYSLTAHVTLERMPTAWRLLGRNTPADDWHLIDQRDRIVSWTEFGSRSFNLSSAVCFATFEFEFLRSNDPKALRISEISLANTAAPAAVISAGSINGIAASSSLLPYDPGGLLDAKQPGWHALPPVSYPQNLTFYFNQQRTIRSVGFLPQDGNIDRGPKAVAVEVSTDGFEWRSVSQISNACTASGVWSDHTFPEPVTTKRVRLKILSNCGHPNLLTLRGVRFLP